VDWRAQWASVRRRRPSDAVCPQALRLYDAVRQLACSRKGPQPPPHFYRFWTQFLQVAAHKQLPTHQTAERVDLPALLANLRGAPKVPAVATFRPARSAG